MEVVLAEQSDRRIWDEYVLAHPDGCAYQLFAWRDAVKTAYGFDSLYLMALDGGRVGGVFPLIDFQRPVLHRRLVSLPYCDNGGILADNPGVAAMLLAAAIDQARRLSASNLDVRVTAGPVDRDGERTKVQMRLMLPESSAALLSGLKAKLRSQVLKPQRDGLYGQVGGVELLSDFYAVFTANMRLLGSPVHSLDWFQAIFSEYRSRARVGVVYTPAGQPAAAGIILLAHRMVSIPWASSLRSLNHLNPNMLLYWNFLAFAADNGFRVFDFGRSTAGEGCFRFKQQWGAIPHRLTWVSFDPEGHCQPGPATAGRLRSRAERIWRHLPLALCNTLGPVIRRHVSL